MFLYRIVIASLFLYGAKVKNIFLIPTNDDNILKYLDKIQIKIHRLQDDLGTIKSSGAQLRAKAYQLAMPKASQVYPSAIAPTYNTHTSLANIMRSKCTARLMH